MDHKHLYIGLNGESFVKGNINDEEMEK